MNSEENRSEKLISIGLIFSFAVIFLVIALLSLQSKQASVQNAITLLFGALSIWFFGIGIWFIFN